MWHISEFAPQSCQQFYDLAFVSRVEGDGGDAVTTGQFAAMFVATKLYV